MDYLPPEKTAEDFPYEFEKMKGPFAAGEVQELDGGSYRVDEDKRIGIGYPVIESLAGGGDTGPINDWLTARRIALSVPDYACASRRYQSFQWDEQSGIGDDYQSESSARLDFLSDRLVGVSEGGSFFCGGAHPDNFSRYQLGDVATGKSVAPESLLKDFTFQDYNGQPLDPARATEDNPGRYVPSEALIARVTRDWKPDGRVTDSGCEMPQLIHDNLSVAFKGSDLVFVLKDLPNYAAACGDDLYAIPLSEAGDLLNRKGKRYFSE